ncbi:MAG: hypothetical protein J6Y69_00295 [Treponema sp.]|nr:hypothetical protein [Treponema sp.]
MILDEFDEERFKKNMREEGYEDGIVDGKIQKAIEAAENLLRLNLLSVEQIAQVQGIPIEQVLKIKEELLRTESAVK